MVRNRILIISLVAAAAILIVMFFPTDKRKIARLLKNTAAWATKEEGDSLLVIAAKSQKAGKFFTKKVAFNYEKRDFERELSLEEIERGYIFLMQQKTKFKVKMADIEIELSGDDGAAGTATLLVESEGASLEGLSNVNEVEYAFQKQDEGWRISGIKIVEVLEK
jgi:hypothetical protein